MEVGGDPEGTMPLQRSTPSRTADRRTIGMDNNESFDLLGYDGEEESVDLGTDLDIAVADDSMFERTEHIEDDQIMSTPASTMSIMSTGGYYEEDLSPFEGDAAETGELDEGDLLYYGPHGYVVPENYGVDYAQPQEYGVGVDGNGGADMLPQAAAERSFVDEGTDDYHEENDGAAYYVDEEMDDYDQEDNGAAGVVETYLGGIVDHSVADDHRDVQCSPGVVVTHEQVNGVSVSVLSAVEGADLRLSERAHIKVGEIATRIMIGTNRKPLQPEHQYKRLSSATHSYAMAAMAWLTGRGSGKSSPFRLLDLVPQLRSRSAFEQISALPQPYQAAIRHATTYFRAEYRNLPQGMELVTLADAIETGYKAQASSQRYGRVKLAKQQEKERALQNTPEQEANLGPPP